MISYLTLAVAVAAGPVQTIRNEVYYDGPGHDEYRHRCDLFLPAGAAKFPTVIFVHGGSWSMGSKDGFLMLPGHRASDHGRFFAERGIAAVHVNYRLSPRVKHPEHARDVARAVAWVRQNIAAHGGDPDRIFLMGHSAGGHLCALVATDPRYLMAEGLTPAMIRGVIGVSGVYSLTGDLTTTREPVSAGSQASGPGVLLGHVFGADVKDHHRASPVQHVTPAAPPFLLAYADRDLLLLPAQAVAFQETLAAAGVPARKMLLTQRDHQTILKAMLVPGDPLGDAVLAFIRTGVPGK
jgi:acetyl esterase/lipase